MTIHLSEQREQLVLTLLRAGKFASADVVIDEGYVWSNSVFRSLPRRRNSR
jgi:hypothetical protein